MLRLRNYFVFVVIIFVAKGSDACFDSIVDQSTVLTTGSNFYQECQCTDPTLRVQIRQWLDPRDQRIETGPGTNDIVYTEETSDSINLHITSISKSMAGKYKCVIYADGRRYVQTYTIDAYDPLYFYNTQNDQFLTFQKDSIITCQAKGESRPRISWQRALKEEFEDIPLAPEKYTIVPEGLLVKNVTEDDSGKYKCTALVISTGEESDKFIDVKVFKLPTIAKVDAYPSATIPVGYSLSIECLAEGTPAATYTWKKLGADPEAMQNWTQLVNEIYIENITLAEEGIYECQASNGAGFSVQNITIEVLEPALVDYFENITEVEGTTIQLMCNATGKPDPNITLAYEGVNFKSDWELTEYDMIPNNAFATLDRSSEGIYICNASNDAGYDVRPMYLTVLHRPYFTEDTSRLEWGYEGKVVKLSCAHESNPAASITWRFESNDIPTEHQVEINKILLETVNNREDKYLTLNIDNSTEYGMYTCTAKNAIGESTKVVYLKKGVKPPVLNTSKITLDEITATSVIFKIEHHFTEDIPDIMGYTAQYDEESNYSITDIHPNRTWSIDRPLKIEKLKPNTTYNVSFAAINEVGTGQYTELLQFITLEKSVPESPVLEEESLQASSNGNHLLKWKEVDDNGEPVEYYVLRYCQLSEESEELTCEVRHIERSTQLELSNLKTNATYFLELIAHNAKGNSSPANISITIPAHGTEEQPQPLLSGGAIIGISIVIVFACLILLDLLLLAWRRQGIIATVCLTKDNTKENAINTRDKKGLLVERVDTSPKDNKGHREFEYNRNTGVVTGKHSAV